MYLCRRLCHHLSVSLMVFFLVVCSPAQAKDTQPGSAAPDAPQPPLIGQTLLKTKTDLLEKSNSLKREIESVNQQMNPYHKGQMLWLRAIISYPLTGSFLMVFLIAGIWTCLLIVMYRNVRREEYLRLKPRLLKLLFFFLVLGLVCVLTGIASAETSSHYQLPKYELPETLEHARQISAMEPSQRVRDALEEQNCPLVDIPTDVMSLIEQNCPDATILNPIKGDGPHRRAAIAALYWASGDKTKALEVLRPIADTDFVSTSPQSRAGFLTALCLFAASMDTETTEKLARQMMVYLDVEGLVWMAGKTRNCCPAIAIESLDKAKFRATTAREVVYVAKNLREFARPDDAHKFVIDNLGMTDDYEGLKVFLTFAKEEGLTEIEQQILSRGISRRERPQALVDLATVYHDLGYVSAAKRAMEKALEKETQSNGLMTIASTALKWSMLDVAQTSLEKVIDTDGFEGCAREFPDPMLLAVSSEKPVDRNPCVGVVIGIISEKRGNPEKAEEYYTLSLNLEIYNKLLCLGSIHDINFANFFYAYRFFVSRNNASLVNLIDPIGRELEAHLVAEIKNEMDRKIAAQQNQLKEMKHNLRVRKIKSFLWKTSVTLFVLFVLIFVVIFIIAQVIAVKRMLEWVKRLDHLRMLGGAAKLIELEGFILLASIIFTPLGVGMIIVCQFILSILLAEAHSFRITERLRTRKAREWLKLPLTYRDH